MKTLFIIPLVLIFAGCSILEPIPDSGMPSAIQLGLSDMLRGYRLPPQSISPSQNADPLVDSAIHSMQKIASDQGLIFDGSQAAKGTVIVGRVGNTDQMILAIAVYANAGRVAMQDAYNWKVSDMSQGYHMRERYLNTLRSPSSQ